MNQQKEIRTIVYMAMYLAIFMVLDWLTNQIPMLQMPEGGSLGLSVIPLILASYHLGWKKGLVVALLSVVLMFITGQIYLVQNSDGFALWQILIQFLMEYPIAFGVYGLCSLFKNYKGFYTGILITGIIRLTLHVIAGHIFWATPWLGSFTYNAWYMIPTTILALIIVPIMIPRLQIYMR